MFRSIRNEIRRQFLGFIALVLVVSGGTAYASHELINSSDIADESIQSVDIRNGQVKSADVLDGSIQSADIRNGHVQNADIQRDAITSDRIRDAGISDSDLAGNTVNSPKVLDNSLTGDDIFDETLGSHDIADGSLLGTDIRENSVSGGEIRDTTVTGDDIGDDTLTGYDVDESSLDTVPDAEKLDGIDSVDLVQGRGVLLTNRRVLPVQPPTQSAQHLLTIPGLGELRTTCSSTGAGIHYFNTSDGPVDFWSDWANAGGRPESVIVPPGGYERVASVDATAYQGDGSVVSLGAGNDPGPRRVATLHPFALNENVDSPCRVQAQGTLWTSP